MQYTVGLVRYPKLFSSPTANVSAYYFVFFGVLSIFLAFLPLYFLSLGFSGVQTGLLNALGPLMVTFLAPIWGNRAEKQGKKQEYLAFTLWVSGLSLLLTAMLDSFYGVLLGMLIYTIVRSGFAPLVDSLASHASEEYHVPYGKMRMWGSLSFGLLVMLAGMAYDSWGYQSMLYVSGILFILIAPTAYWLPRQAPRDLQAPAIRKRDAVLLIRQQFSLLMLFVASFLMGLALGFDGLFFGPYTTHIGGSISTVGIAVGMSALIEVPIMFYLHKVFAWLPGVRLLIVGYGCYLLVYVLYFLAHDPSLLLWGNAIKGVAFALFFTGTMTLLGQRVPAEHNSTVLGFFNAVAFGLAQIAAFLLAGWYMDVFGLQYAYVLCIALCTVAIAVLVASLKF